MRLLDRYLLRELMVPLGYCLTGFLIFWLTFDLFGELGDLQEQQLSFSQIFAIYVQKLPQLLVVVIPVALLLAMLYSLSNHSRHNELIAVRAAGVSLWRIAGIYLAVGALFSGALFFINEVWAVRQIGLESERSGPMHLELLSARQSLDLEDYDLVRDEMIRPRLTWKLSDDVTVKIVADSGSYSNKVWIFKNLVVFRHDPGKSDFEMTQSTNHLAMAIKELALTPRQVRSERRISSLLDSVAIAKEAQVSLREIADYRMLHPDLPEAKRVKLETQYHGRFAWPLTCMVVVLISIPFGGRSGRRNAFVGVASSIVICFVYFILMRVCLALGTGGRLLPWLAAWLPNLFFGGGGCVLIARMR